MKQNSYITIVIINMAYIPKHTQWLTYTGDTFKTVDDKDIHIYDFHYVTDHAMLSEWATHFRNHYCLDKEIDYFRRGYKFSRKDYLEKIKFPDSKLAPGPSIRSGDFSEILVSDFLEYIMGFWVPRTRYIDKTVRNESTKGADIIGFKMLNGLQTPSCKDELAIFEAKAQFSGKKAKSRVQDAIDGSAKDIVRKAESLNAMKQRLFDKQSITEADIVERFQNQVDEPYKEVYGAVALFDNNYFDVNIEARATTALHPHNTSMLLVAIKGKDMMKLTHELYRRAAHEA